MSRRNAEPVKCTPCQVRPSGSNHQMRGAAKTPTPLTRNSHRQWGATIGYAITVIPVPKPDSSASALTACPRLRCGASSTINAVATPTTSTSKQTAKSLRNARSASEGTKALAKLTREKPPTPTAISRRRPKRSASIASGTAPRVPTARIEPSDETAGVLAWNSLAIAGSDRIRIEPSNPDSTTASPAQISVTRCLRSSSTIR